MTLLTPSLEEAEGRQAGAPRLLQERVGEWARGSPDATALVYEGRHVSYGELVRRVRRLARRLRGMGVGPEVLVGVSLERSPELVVSILGVLEAGGAYLPLDPSYPRERLELMVRDSGVGVLVAEGEGPAAAAAEGWVRRIGPGRGTRREPPVIGDRGRAGAWEGSPEGLPLRHPAYAIYTSGSTGRPKGVLVAHRGLSNLAEAQSRIFAVDPGSRVLQFAPASFDASVSEIAVTLWAGATLVLAPQDRLLPGSGLSELLARERVTCLTLPPSVLSALPEGELPDLDTLVCAGEALPGELVVRWGTGRRMLNAYGPTETTVCATAGRCRPGEERPPIGRAIPGFRLSVTDPSLRPVPREEEGELVLGGVAVARGYLGRPALTAERFVPDPPSDGAGEPGARAYRTGDLARIREDDRLEFLGRVDHQVKIRGHRVEPGEVEAVLADHPGVRSAAVVARRDRRGEPRLLAYAVPLAGAPESGVEALRTFLADRLPEYLRPSGVVLLDELPLLPNGKVDRRALVEEGPEPEGRKEPEGRVRPPGSEVEVALAGIWRELLGASDPGLGDDFFELGGHSLLVGRLVSRVRRGLGVELSPRAVFEGRTLEAVARAVEETSDPPLPPVERAPRDRPLPLTHPQQRIWFILELEPGNVAYNSQVTVRFEGTLSIPVLHRALRELVHRHEAFRSRYFAVDGEPFQEPLPAPPVPLPLVDLRGLPEARRREAVEGAVLQEGRRPFDVSRPPLVRWRLFLEDQGVATLQHVEHHFVHDGWSFAVVLSEIQELYRVFLEGRPSPLPEPFQIGDVALWQRRLMTGERLREHLDYWTGRLEGAPPVLELPADRPRPPTLSFQGDVVRIELPLPLARRVRELARSRGVTLFAVLLAGFDLLLSRYTGEEDLVVGSGHANRRTEEAERVVGMLVNTLVLRLDLGGEPTFAELLTRATEVLLGSQAYQDMPLEKLIEALGLPRDPSRNPLFQVLFSFHDSPVPDVELPELTGSVYERHNKTAKTDLNVIAIPRGEQRVGRSAREGDDAITLIWEYSTDLFDRTTMLRMVEQYQRLLSSAHAAPGRRVSELSLMSLAERAQVLVEWNDTAVASRVYPRESSIPELFAAEAARRPEAPALRQGRRWWTYGELDARSDRLAARLAALGVGPETLVGLAAERSPELVAGLLGILKAGGAYLPLDPSYPPERLAFMLEDGGVPVLLVAGEGLAVLPEAELERLGTRTVALEEALSGDGEGAEPPSNRTGPRSLAYVLYTSGSTGRPKGVAVEHRSVVRLVRGASYASMDEDEVFLQLAPVPFDASTLEIWGPLLNGGRLEVFPPGVPSLEELGRGVEASRVTTLWLTAGLYHRMVEEELPRLAGVRQLLAGGDVISVPHVERTLEALEPGGALINGYGPTEGTTFTCCHRMAAGAAVARETVPVGRPVSSTWVHLVQPGPGAGSGPGLTPVPVGVPGELYAGGDGVARGYLARPSLTAGAFVPDPFGPSMGGAPGGRLYRTGDLARWLPDGAVEFLGRMDHQVKLRGFRIELGEIESVLTAHPAIGTAAVVVREGADGDGRLVAYAVPAAGEGPEPEALRAHLAEHLPDYMVPSAFVTLERLPLDPNGKVDRRALRELAPGPRAGTVPGGGPVPARGPVEEMVAGIWAEVLGIAPPRFVGAHDDFFELGGHSLAATSVVSRLRRAFGVEVPLRTLFEEPTVAGLASRVAGLRERAPGAEALPIRSLPREGEPPFSFAPSFSQERMWFLDRFETRREVYNVPAPVRLRGRLDAASLAGALHDLEERHEGLRTVFAEADSGEGEARVLQVVGGPERRGLPVLDLSSLAGERGEEELGRLAVAGVRRPFDLARGPLWRFRLARLGPEDHALFVAAHHSVTDGWSMGVFFRELWELYAARTEGRRPRLPELPVQYPDFAVWQREWLRGPTLHREVDWWRERLAGAPPVLELPTDRPRPPERSGRGGRLRTPLPQTLLDGLRSLGERRRASLFMVLLAALQAWLGRLSGQADLSVGAPVANRTRSETEGVVGFFVNSLVLRADLTDDPPFEALLERVRETALSAFAHQDLPFEKLVEALEPERHLERTPLYQVSLVLQNAAPPADPPPGLQVEPLAVEAPTAKFDLTFGFEERREQGGGLLLRTAYSLDLFDPTTARRWVRQLRTVLEAAVEEPTLRLSELPLLDPGPERHALLYEWSASSSAPPEGAPLHRLVARWAEERPEAVAVAGLHHQLSYGELLRRAEALARWLAGAGAGSDRPVAVLLDRSPEAVVACLAAARAGAPYVPLDPDHPRRRLAFMLEDSAPAVVVTSRRLREGLPETGARVLEVPADGAGAAPETDPPRSSPPPETPAYVLYTSGSTGRPNGVAIPQGAVAEHLRAMAEALPLEPRDTVLWKTPAGFDPSVWELWAPLVAGVRLALARPGGHREPAYLTEAAGAHRATVLRLVPTLFQAILDGPGPDACPDLRRLFVGGEVLPPAAARRFLAAGGAELVNSYGPTETTVTSTLHRLSPGAGPEGVDDPVPIGRPVGNLRAHVLDPGLRPAPLGASGELVLAGPTLASGYRRRPALTAERFVPDPLPTAAPGGAPDAGGGRLYRTGDRARFRPDGRLEFLGRLDRQVKVRGVRLELEEIESLLVREEGVLRAAALVRDGSREVRGGPPDDRRLVAYAVLAPESGRSADGLRQALARRLPRAVVPSTVILLPELPLLPNGKVDRQALAERPLGEPEEDRESGVPPRDPVEEMVADVWSQVLEVGSPGAFDDFFRLGGHSLLAVRLASRLRRLTGVEVPLRSLFEEPTVAGHARALERLRRGPEAPEEPPLRPQSRDRARPRDLPASFAQERVWFVGAHGENRFLYNVPIALRLRGPLAPPPLARAVAAVVERHESLRTVFHPSEEGDAGVVQRVLPRLSVPLPLVDLRRLPPERRRPLAEELAVAESEVPFALDRGPLLRTVLLQLGRIEGHEEGVLLLTLHHIVSDAWSTGVLLRELGTAYRACREGRRARLPRLPIQYADFAVWQREWLGDAVLEKLLAFWRRELEGAPALLELPTDRSRPALQGHRGDRQARRLSPELSRGLRSLARERGVSLFMALLAAFQALLARLSGGTDVPVGVPVANRSRVETECLIGLFVNALVLRGDLSGDPPFRELLEATRRRAMAAYDHQELPFEKLVQELRPERDLSHAPLFQVVLNLHQARRPAGAPGRLGDLKVSPLAPRWRTAKFDLVLNVLEEDTLWLRLEHALDLFDPTTAKRLLGWFEGLLTSAVEEPERRLSELGILGGPERHQLLLEWSGGPEAAGHPAVGEPVDRRLQRTVHLQVAARAAERPDAVAVAAPGRCLTYGELEARACLLARRLSPYLGSGARRAGSPRAGAEPVVALLVGRSPEAAAGALAAWKVGGAYLPMDPAYPAERLAHMLEDSGAVAVLAREELREVLPETDLPVLPCRPDGSDPEGGGPPAPLPDPECPEAPERLAYVIYTSGTTGRPKGVELTHRGLANLVAWHRATYDLAPGDRTGLLAGPGFDASVWELWPTLASGACLAVPEEPSPAAPEELAPWLARQGITATFLATPLAEALLDALGGEPGPGAVPEGAPDLSSLRVLLTGGDRLHRPPQPGLHFVLVNHYGPTESTVVTTACGVPPGSPSPPPIGRPVDGLRVLLADREFHPVPLGVPGELLVAGRGLARGYRRRPAETAARFVPYPGSSPGSISGSGGGWAPSEPGGRSYRTGDLARHLPDGRIGFLGRIDSQVQVRGLRVELGEIESVLGEHRSVRETAVVARPLRGGTETLVAYVVAEEGELLESDGLRAFAARRLPEYMVPAAFVPLDRLPLDAHGKVDRRALAEEGPEPEPGGGTRFVPPRGPVEEMVAEVWRGLLPVERVGVHDDFFELGGHSLLATRVISRLRRLTGVELPLRRLFEHPTVAELAALLGRAREEPGAAAEIRKPPIEPLSRDWTEADGTVAFPASFAQERLWFLARFGAEPSQYNIPAPARFRGALEPAPLARALAEVVRRHEALRTTFSRGSAGVVQRVLQPGGGRAGELPVIDLTRLPEPAREPEARRLAAADARRPFELDRGPLLRARLVRLSRRDHVLLLSMHHIVSDGWSLSRLFRELSVLYGALRGGRRPPVPELPSLPVQYPDYTVWQREWLSGEVLERQIGYWRERLAGAPAVLELPTDRPRPPVQTTTGGEAEVALPAELLSGVRRFCRERGVTLYMALVAGFQTLLGRLGGATDVPVGAPVAGRNVPEVEELIGFFVNTLVLRGDLSGDPPFTDLLEATRDRALEAYAHQDVPFEKLVEELEPERNLSHTPIFQVLLVLQNAPPPEPELPGLEWTGRFADRAVQGAKFDLTLGLTESGEGLTGGLSYNRDLFDLTTVRRWLGHFATLLSSAVETPERRLSELALLAPAERHQLVREWNDTAAEVETSEAALLHAPFEARSAEHPDRVALVAGGPEHLSYGELRARASRLAGELAARGVGLGTPVGVHLDRSSAMAVAVLAVAKAGGAYVPLEAGWPADRIRWIVSERGVRHLVTESSRLETVAGSREGLDALVVLDRLPTEASAEPEPAPSSTPGPGPAGPEDLAYVIFTSGSTGRPKGVLVRHRAAAHLVSWVNETFGVGPDDRLFFVTALSFDLSVYDVFGTLAAGGTVRLATAEELADPVRQVEVLVQERITFWDSAPAALQRLAPLFPEAPARTPAEAPALRRVFLSGDWVPLTLPDRVRESFPEARVVALGGATEATIWSNYFPVEEVADEWVSIPYGRPMANARYHVLDRGLRPCPIGAAGDLYIAGECLSSGYAGSPGLTARSYIPDPFGPEGPHGGRPGELLYRTGDRARYFPDGNLEFLGRSDTQVQLRGFRIELGEIEAVLMEHPGVAEALALAREDTPGDQRLVAYWIPAEGDQAPDPDGLRRWTARKLPEYMVPTGWVEQRRWPLSPTGKLDRAALPAPHEVEDEGGRGTRVPQVPPRTRLERTIAGVWREVLGVSSVSREANFFDLGGHSLLLARVHERLEEELTRELAMAELFRNPTVATLAEALSEARPEEEAPEALARETPDRRPAGSGAVAIVGMAGRFPGARDPEELWQNLRAGVESIRFFGDEELAEAGFDPEALRDPSLVKARGVLDDPDLFDAAFFGYSPREAEVIDPQQRLFLESAWQALEDAGHAPDAGGRGTRVGVFGGVSGNGYLRLVEDHPEVVRALGSQQIVISNHPDYLPTRVSYKLHLTGPSLAVQTACSTSLVAVHLACRSLLEGECDLALAGGASVRAREVAPYRYAEGGISSPDGHTRAFDAGAEGVVGGSGVGVVVLKRLEDAVADGDTIRAVVRGSAVNNDGGLKAGFTAPSATGQAEVIREALETAGVAPETVGYVEAHGTATPLGDPIEVEGLTRAFGAGGRAGAVDGDGEKTCALGSVKTNIGHLDAAAGVAGLIKAVLALEHREIPPSLHFRVPNPAIDFEASPFFVANRLLPWESDGRPRRAGVSSFGIGGTNAHAVLEEAPPLDGADETGGVVEVGSAPARTAELLVLSARSEEALDRATEELARHLRDHPELPVPDAAWTLQVGRRPFPWRRAVVAPSGQQGDGAPEALERRDRRWSRSGLAPEEPPRVAYLLPGQGAQLPRMGEALYREEPVFRQALDRCLEVLEPELGSSPQGALRDLLYPETDRRYEEAEERLAATEVTQPVLLAVEHALMELWASWGVEPVALVGHSLGEYAAAARAGVLELEDALRLVAARGRLMGSRPGGAMLGVRLSEEGLEPYLEEDDALALAAVNAPDATVISGPSEAVAALRERLEAEGVGCRPLHTSHAFHSGMMEPVVAPFRELVARLELRPPKIPFVSSVTGTWITAEEATDPGYWARQLRSPVRFADGLSAIVGDSEETAARWALLEVGPGRTLTTLARRHPTAVGARVLVPSTRHPRQAGSDVEGTLSALGALWVAGVEVDWVGHHRGLGEGIRRRRVPLPTYPFERRSYWVGGGLPGRSEEQPPPAVGPSPVAPTGELSGTEAAVAAAFRELLGVQEPGREDDFFDLGGSSLMALQLGSRLREHPGLSSEAQLPSDLLLQASTVGELAALLDERRSARGWAEEAGEAPAAGSCRVPLRRSGSRRPLFLVHQVGGHVYSFRSLAKALPSDQPVYGLRSPGLEAGEEPLDTVEAMAGRYLELVREVQPRGPYRLGGASMGGMVAFEMAHRLRGAGEEVELLALMDTPCDEQMPPRPEDDAVLVAAAFAGRARLDPEELRPLDPEDRLRLGLERAREAGRVGEGFDLDQARRLLRVLRANLGALYAYDPRPYRDPMILFCAAERRPGEEEHRPELAWVRLARGGIDVTVVPGNHDTMHEPPGAEVMALRLEARLAATGPGGSAR